MGQGDGKRFPVDQLIWRYGVDVGQAAWRSIGRDVDVLKKLIRMGKIPLGQDVVVLLDMPQTIEKMVHSPFRTGFDLYENGVKTRILDFIGIPQVKEVIVCMDCTKNENRAKEMCYYSLYGGRRKNVIPIEIKPDQMFLDDIIPFPEGKWTQFKCCEMARRQVNFYFASKFAMETRLPDYGDQDYSGLKTVIFDNCIHSEDLFSTSDPNMVPYHAKTIQFRDGSQVFPSEVPASEISEAEYAMQAFITSFAKRDAEKRVSRTYVCVSIDQDIIPLSLLAYKDRIGESHANCSVFTLMQSFAGGTVGTTVFDINLIAQNILSHHKYVLQNEHLPIESEVLLFLIGGCDNFKKPFRGIAYCKNTHTLPESATLRKKPKRLDDTIHAEFIDKFRVYAKMLREVQVRTPNCLPEEQRRDSCLMPETMTIIDVDFDVLGLFAKNLYKRKNQNLSKRKIIERFNRERTNLYVTMRQLAFTMLYMTQVPRVRALHMTPINISPMTVDACGTSVWGYHDAKVEGAQGLVCASASSVAIHYFDN